VKLRPKNRQKRCYNLAWRYLCTDERYNEGSWSLVQGEITSKISGIPLGHSWLISSTGRAYDPVHNEQYSSADYTTKFNATPQKEVVSEAVAAHSPTDYPLVRNTFLPESKFESKTSASLWETKIPLQVQPTH
jgi:hypothetical protein